MKWLSIHYKVSFWLVPFLLFICFTSNTYAAIAPSGTVVQFNGLFPDMTSYCQANVPGGKQFQEVVSTPVTQNPGSTVNGNGYVGLSSLANGGSTLTCKSTDDLTYGQIGTDGQYCLIASGSTNNNGILSCTTCPPGYEDQGGTCVVEISCDAAGTSAGENFWNGSKGGGGCIDGCAVQADGGCISVTSEISGITSTSCTRTSFTGQSCESQPNVVVGANVKDDIAVPPENDPPQSSQDCSPGTGFAQVNNETMCLPSGTTIDGETKTSTSNGGTTTETTTTTVNPDGTTTTETTSSYTDSGGNTISGSTTTQSGINQAGGGNNQDDKGLGPAPTFDQSLPEEPEINILTVPTPTLSMDIFTNTASCPAPITFTAMDQDFEISFDSVCAFADVIRGIILLISAIAAIRIVVKD